MSGSPSRQPDAWTLRPADADAFEALVEAAWRVENLPPFLRPRASAILALLAPLESAAPALDESEEQARVALIERTLTRVRAGALPRSARPGSSDDARLAPDEQAAVDALVASGWDPDRARFELSERSEHLSDIVALLDRLGGEERSAAPPERADAASGDDEQGLVERTLRLVQEEIDRSERLRRLGAPAPALVDESDFAPRVRLGARLWDVIGVAAAVALGASVLMPILGAARQRAMRATGAARLADAGLGFSLYGNDHFGALPAFRGDASANRAAATGFTAGGSWWNVGQPADSHSADLFVLAKQKYTSVESLASPGNSQAPIRLDLTSLDDWRRPEEISFSYQLFPAGDRLRFADFARPGVLLADRSPVTTRSIRGEASQATAGSPNQRGRGLLVLFSDGAVDWLHSPILPSGDNIWLPAFAEGASPSRVLLRGVERPANKKDAFVGP